MHITSNITNQALSIEEKDTSYLTRITNQQNRISCFDTLTGFITKQTTTHNSEIPKKKKKNPCFDTL
jgi:hypothetical protein